MRLRAIKTSMLSTAALATAFCAGTGTSSASEPVRVVAHYAATVMPDADSTSCGGFDVTAAGTAGGQPISPTVSKQTGTWSDQERVCTLTVPGTYDINGTAVLGSPDGSQLFLSYHVSAPLIPNVTTIYPTGSFTVVRGTGCFAGRSGGGVVTAVVNLADTQHVTATLAGSLDG